MMPPPLSDWPPKPPVVAEVRATLTLRHLRKFIEITKDMPADTNCYVDTLDGRNPTAIRIEETK